MDMIKSIDACRAEIAEIEQAMWAGAPSELLLESYQAAFRQLEQLVALQGEDRRHKFVVVIPVADRPQHLQSCLDSLLQLCKLFGYGGMADGRYRKLAVIIADDTRDADNIARNREIARHCDEQGIETHYLGLDEQLELVDRLDEAERSALSGILGSYPAGADDRAAFSHKGPSLMRNIAYLKLKEMSKSEEKLLFYFIDSDQEFRVKVSTPAGDRNLYASNYLYYLDRIFSETDTTILTGKVVGDPPVSPAVMAGNFLEDVIGFVHRAAAADPAQPCQFHAAPAQLADDAAYHDMAGLFGFQPTQAPYQYRCTLHGAHDNARCFGHFASKLKRFFYGEHPTRKTYYHHEDLLAGIRPARTIYTGNYIFKPEGLKYFIPFATLKLRMAGPVLGRILKSELGARFVSANLPMLHKRTVGTTGQSEFRPGIAADIAKIDLSGEFERQFYGDVMLFTMEKLTAMGYPQVGLTRESVAQEVEATHASLQQQYREKRQAILEKLHLLQALVRQPENWWNRSADYAEARAGFDAFMDNIALNFGESVFDALNSPANKARRHAAIIAAIARYAHDARAWAVALDRLGQRA